MTDVVAQCRTTWKRLGVSARARADLQSELTNDLAAAAEDGVDASTFVGSDAAAFAHEWALARGVTRARWHVLGCGVVAAVVGLGVLVALDLLVRPAWLSQFFGRQNAVNDSWLHLYSQAAPVFVVPVLLAVALFLKAVKDPLALRTLVVALVASPAALWVCAQVAPRLDGTAGTVRGALTVALLFATATVVLRATVTAVSRTTTSVRAGRAPAGTP